MSPFLQTFATHKPFFLGPIRSRIFISLLLVLIAQTSHAGAATSYQLTQTDWIGVIKDSRSWVSRESPPSAIPFTEAGVEGRSGKLVVAHYFPLFQLSIDNKPASEDYYARNYLRPEGEGGKFRAVGGFLRERPLPVPVWPLNRYAETNLAIDVLRAAGERIDAFGVDLPQIGSGNSWSVALSLCDVAARVSKTFKVIPEPDMVSLRGVSVLALADALQQFGRCHGSYRLPDGRLLVIPFAAEVQQPSFWKSLISVMKAGGSPIALVPDFVDPAKMADYAEFSDAFTVWGDRDAAATRAHISLAKAARQINAKDWFMPVSPQDYRPKDGLFWEAQNSLAFRQEWSDLIRLRFKYVHLLTWNDYSESTEISPSSFTQFVFFDLTKFYIEWFKSGVEPRIDHDAIYYLQRPQIFDPLIKNRGGAVRRNGSTALTNDVELIAMLTSPGRISIRIGREHASSNVSSGIHILRLRASPGVPVFSLARHGKTVITKTSDWPISDDPYRHDAMYGGGSTTRPLAPASASVDK